MRLRKPAAKAGFFVACAKLKPALGGPTQASGHSHRRPKGLHHHDLVDGGHRDNGYFLGR